VKGGNQEMSDARGGKGVAGALGVGLVCCQCGAAMSSTANSNTVWVMKDIQCRIVEGGDKAGAAHLCCHY
jgi:hypothetical protein